MNQNDNEARPRIEPVSARQKPVFAVFLMRLALGFLLWWISAWLLHVYVLMPKKSMPGSMFPVCVWDGARPMPMFLAEREKAGMPKRLCTEAVDYHEADRPYWLQLEEIAPATFHLQVWNDSMGDPFESAYQVASTHPERIIPLWQRRGANMARALSFFYAVVPSIVLYKLLFYLRARRLKKKQQASVL